MLALGRFGRSRAPKLSDVLVRPSWLQHPLSARLGNSPARYILCIPTFAEGHEVGSEVAKALLYEKATFKVIVGYFAQDPTEAEILKAASSDERIIPLRVDKIPHDV